MPGQKDMAPLLPQQSKVVSHNHMSSMKKVSRVPFLLILPIASAESGAGAAFIPTSAKPPFVMDTTTRSSQKYRYRRRLKVGHDENILTLQNDSDESRHLLMLLSNPDRREQDVADAISALESSFRASTNDTTVQHRTHRFNDLLGLYEVQGVLPSDNSKNNPVGGKWTRSNGTAQKFFRTRTSFQHLLPFHETASGVAAEAVNAISLDALNGFIRAAIVLRGDVVPLSIEERTERNANRTASSTPLSDLAVRAHFDSPRIFLGRRRRKSREGYEYLPLQLGPTSSVILDTTYYDDKVRIGMGGTSGTRFVFVRTNDGEAREYESLMSMPLASKTKILSRLGVVMASSLFVALNAGGMSHSGERILSSLTSAESTVVNSVVQSIAGVFARVSRQQWLFIGLRVLAGISSFFIGLSMLLIAFSSGGIEKDEMT
ncbi:hypothetical protein ACHAW6_009010 [Cyclotella cf. meneghiniana]